MMAKLRLADVSPNCFYFETTMAQNAKAPNISELKLERLDTYLVLRYKSRDPIELLHA